MAGVFVEFFSTWRSGLAYLGNWKGAIVNLALVIGVGIFFTLVVTDELYEKILSLYPGSMLAGGSAGYANLMAKQMNQKISGNQP